MRKFLISAAAAAAATVAVATPASAQWGQGRYETRDDRGYGRQHYANRQAINQLMRDLDRVENRIHRSAQRGAISQREAQSLRRQANEVRQRIHRAGRDGISQREYAVLRDRVNRLEYRLREERRDGDRRRW